MSVGLSESVCVCAEVSVRWEMVLSNKKKIGRKRKRA